MASQAIIGLSILHLWQGICQLKGILPIMRKFAICLLMSILSLALHAQDKPPVSLARTTDSTGFFAAQYAGAQNKEVIGIVGAFKSLAGWQDGRYYILVRDYKPGTIVRVQNTKNNRVIYAKVLGLLPNLKKDAQLLARLSNAGCAALGIQDESSFEVVISD